MRAPTRLGIAHLQTYADDDAPGALASRARAALVNGLSRCRDVVEVLPIKFSPPSLAAVESRQRLADELQLEYLIYGSIFHSNGISLLIIHLEYLPRTELIWSSKIELDNATRDNPEQTIGHELIPPMVYYLCKNEDTSRKLVPDSEEEQSFKRAKWLMSRQTLATLDEARRRLSAILGRFGPTSDVCIALARAEHSRGLLMAGEGFVAAIERARALAQQAIELDELNPRAHAELALQELFLKHYATAADRYQLALELNPYDAVTQADWGDCLTLMGRPAQALPILERAASSWPRDRAWVKWNLCDAEWALDRPDRIIGILADQGDLPHVHRLRAASYAKLGRLAEARDHAAKVRGRQPGFSAKAWRQVLPWRDDVAEDYTEHLARAGL